jgi:hypothetical protein
MLETGIADGEPVLVEQPHLRNEPGAEVAEGAVFWSVGYGGTATLLVLLRAGVAVAVLGKQSLHAAGHGLGVELCAFLTGSDGPSLPRRSTAPLSSCIGLTGRIGRPRCRPADALRRLRDGGAPDPMRCGAWTSTTEPAGPHGRITWQHAFVNDNGDDIPKPHGLPNRPS